MSIRAAVLAGALTLPWPSSQVQPAQPAGQLPLRVTTAVGRGGTTDGSKLRLTATVDSPDPQARLKALSATLAGASGNVAASWAAPAAVLAGGPVTFTVTALPGHYTLRIAASDRAARAGNLEVGVDLVLVTAGSLRLGSLNLGVAPASPLPVTTPARGGRGDIVTPTPSARAQFTDESNAVAFFDLYGGVANEHVSIVVEIRRRPDGPPIQLLQATIQPARAGEPDHYLVTAPVNLASLAPGDYEVRATVGIAGQAPGVITRTLRKVPAGGGIH